jgi:ribosomal protein L27
MQRTIRYTLLTCLLVSCLGSAAYADVTGWGPRVGISSNPDQLVVGGQIVISEIAPRISFEPDVELGFGDDVTLVAINGDFHYNFEVSGSDWTPYAGFGIGVNFFEVDEPAPFEDHSDTEVGGNILIGASVPTSRGNRFFSELKLGLGDIPDLKLLVGWNFGAGR